MTNKMIISFVMGVILASAFLVSTKWYQSPQVLYGVKRDTVITHDTVVQIIEREIPVTYTRTVYQPQIVYVDSSGFNNYADTVHVEKEFYLFYKAAINGTLRDISLSYYDNRPIKQNTIFETNTITEIQTVRPKGLYVGLSAGQQNISPTVLYLLKGNLFGVQYNLLQNSVDLTYAKKL